VSLGERAEGERLGPEIVDGVGLRLVPDGHRVRDGIIGAEPLELGRFETNALGLQLLGQRYGVREQDLGAILHPRPVDVVAGDHAAGARHVLHDDGRIAGNVAGEMLADGAAVEIVAAARIRPHQDRDGLALVEIGAALGRAGRGAECRRQRGVSAEARGCVVEHGRPPMDASSSPQHFSFQRFTRVGPVQAAAGAANRVSAGSDAAAQSIGPHRANAA
jgi:hypothetical protein